MAEQYEGTFSADITVHVEGIFWSTEQTDEHSDTSLRSVIEQELAGDVTDRSDVETLLREASEVKVTGTKVTEFAVDNHYGPDGGDA